MQSPDRLVQWDNLWTYLFMAISLVLLFACFVVGNVLHRKWKMPRMARHSDVVELSLISKNTQRIQDNKDPDPLDL